MTKTRVVLAMALALLLWGCGQPGALPSPTPTITHEPTATPTIVPTQTPAPRATPTEREPTATRTPPLPSDVQTDHDFVRCLRFQAFPVGQKVTSGISTFAPSLATRDWDAACLVIPTWVDSVAEGTMAFEACPKPADPVLVDVGAYYSAALGSYAMSGDFLLDLCASSAMIDRFVYLHKAEISMRAANQLLHLSVVALADYSAAQEL